MFGDNTTVLIKEVISKLKNNGKYVGLATGDLSEETLEYWHDMGVDMISAGADFSFLTTGMVKNRENLERIHKFNHCLSDLREKIL